MASTIDMTSNFDKVEDLWGNLDSKVVIYMDSALIYVVPQLLKIMESKYLLIPLIETFPSTLLLRQMFNERIKIGNLVLDRPPKIVIMTSNEMKALKEWDLLLIKQSYGKLKMVIASEEEGEMCKFGKIAVPNPEYSSLGKTFVNIYTVKCRTPGDLVFSNLYHREIPLMIKSNAVNAGVLWEHEAKVNNLKIFPLNRVVNLEIGAIKGCDNTCLEEFKVLVSDEVKNEISKIGIEVK